MGWPLRTMIYDICKKCGRPLTESAYGTGYWDFRITRDPHECTPQPTERTEQ